MKSIASASASALFLLTYFSRSLFTAVTLSVLQRNATSSSVLCRGDCPQRLPHSAYGDISCSHILECIAGGCPLHVDPVSYSFDAVSAVSAIHLCCPSSDRSAQLTTARVQSVIAYSCFLRYTVDLIALDVSDIEMALCLDAAQSAVSRECGRELPLLFLTKPVGDFKELHGALALGDFNETDMQLLHEYSPAIISLVATSCSSTQVGVLRQDEARNGVD
jgi:hypothetical protein